MIMNMKQNYLKYRGYLGMICLLLALLLVPGQALAADSPEIGVQLNGEAVEFTDAAPVNENGRVYVPFRAVFEALDAKVDYRAEDGQIMAEKDGTNVIFKVQQNTVTIDNGNANTITIDAPPFIRDGRTYVPVRFAAQTLGLEVGWDSASSTVVMLDKAELKEAAKGQYTLMDNYLKFAKMQNLTGPVKANGNLKFEMQIADGSGPDAVMVPVTGTMKLSGISSAEKADMELAVAMNLDDLNAALQQNGEVTAEDKAVMDALKNISMKMLLDNEKGTAYVQSDIFAMAGMDGSAWYKMNLSQMAAGSGMNVQALQQSEAAALNSYEASVLQMIDSLMPENALTCEIMLKTLDMYRDDAFQKVGSQYMSSMKYNLNGMTVSMSITLKTNGSTVTGYQEATAMYMGTAPLMTMKTDQSGSRASMDMTMNVQGLLTMKVNGDITYSAAQEKPQSAPPSGAVILDMTQNAA